MKIRLKVKSQKSKATTRAILFLLCTVSIQAADKNETIDELMNDPVVKEELEKDLEPAPEKPEAAAPQEAPSKNKMAVSASDQVIQERQALTEHFETRVVSSDQSVVVRETKSGLEIVMRHDQLFLPGLDILRDQALEQLQAAVEKMKAQRGKKILLKSVARYRGEKPLAFTSTIPFSMSEEIHGPNTRRSEIQSITSESKDLEAHRSVILFTHLMQQAWTK